MPEYIISEKQLHLLTNNISFQNKLSVLKNNLKNLDESQKVFVEEVLSEIESKKVISESKWYNTVMDVLGLVDPTPTIDFINGISYIHQGDNLFGLLSLISAFPGIGDLIAKPVTGALKTGSKATKQIELALAEAKLGNNLKAEEILSKVAKEPGAVGNFIRSGSDWAPTAAKYLNKIPLGPFKGLRTTILNWFGLFERTSINSKAISSTAGKLASQMTSTISKEEKIKLLTNFANDAKNTNFFNPLNFYKSSKSPLNLWGGMPRLFGNRESRALVRKTKFWLGFLDFLGLGNFVGPDEVEAKLGGPEKMEEMVKKYQETEEAKKNFEIDFGDIGNTKEGIDFLKGLAMSSPLKQIASSIFK